MPTSPAEHEMIVSDEAFYTDLAQLVADRREQLIAGQFSGRRHGNIDPKTVSLQAVVLVKQDLAKYQGASHD